MGLAAEYHGYRFMQDGGSSGGKGTDFEFYGTVSWTVDIGRVYAVGHAGLVSSWNANGYKIGLLLLEGQTIQSFVYGGTQSSEHPRRDRRPRRRLWHAARLSLGGMGPRKRKPGVRPDPTQCGDVQGSGAARRGWPRLPAHPGGIAALAGLLFAEHAGPLGSPPIAGRDLARIMNNAV